MATIEPIKSPHIKPTSTLGDRVRSLRLPPEPEPSVLGNKRLWMSAGVVLLTVLALFAWQFTGGAEVATSGDEPQVAATAPAPAASSTPAPAAAIPAAGTSAPTAGDQPVAASGEVTLQATGYVVPAHQILISPKVSGMVTLLNFEEGKRVEKGDLLAELESVDYTADVARARSMLESARHKLLEMENGARVEELNAAKADLAEAEAQRVQLLSEYKRNLNLRSNKTVTERDFEQSESSYRAMDRRVARLKSNLQLLEEGPRKERIDGAKADVMTAEAELAKAEW